MDNLHIFLGATVADAAARPLHWVYDPKKLNQYIKGKKEIAFLKKNKSPFYSIKTGKVSGYNDVGQVMFKTLISTKKKLEILKNFKRNIVKNFGPGSAYWKNLKLRKKYISYPLPIALLFAKDPQDALMSLPLLRLKRDKKPLSCIIFENLSILSCEAGLKLLFASGLNSIRFNFDGTFFIILINSLACSSVIFSSKQIHSIKIGNFVLS